MAVLETLRKRMGLLLAIVIGLALFGFVLQDLFTSGGSTFTGKRFEIAEVDGKSISYQQYQGRIDEMVEIYQLVGNNRVDEATQESIQEQTWQDLIREYVLEEKYQRLGLDVSSDELFDMVQGPQPDPMIVQLFTDPQTGIFNRAALINFLRNRDADPTGAQSAYWIFLENELYNQRKFTKYNNLVRKGLYVTDRQASLSQQERSRKADFSFVFRRYNYIADSLVKVSKDEIQAYYKKHRENFKQSASRDIEYVAFDIKASPNDIEMTESRITRLKNEFAEVGEIAQYVNLNSDVPYDNRNYKNGELPSSINDFVFSAQPGEVFGPYFENEAYKLSRLVEIKYLPDSVKARHILVIPSQEYTAAEAGIRAKNLADSLKNLITRGADFARLAEEYSQDPGSASLGGNLGWFTEGTMVPEFNDACFNGKKGDVVVVETQFGYHVIHIQELGAPVKKVKVATLVHELIPSSQTYQNIYSQASRFAGMNNTFQKFLAAIDQENLSKRIANDIQADARQVPGLENPRPLIRAAFETGMNRIVLDYNDQAVFELGNRFVIAYVTGVREEGYAPLETVRAEIELELIKQKKAEMISREITEAMKDVSNLGDLAAKLNLEVFEANNISYSSFSVPSAGIEPALIASALSVPANTLSSPIAGNNGIYVIVVTNIVDDPAPELAQEKTRLFNSFQSRANYEAYEALKDKANINDKRSRFF